MLPRIWKLIHDHTTKRPLMAALAKVWPVHTQEYSLLNDAYTDQFVGHRRQWRKAGGRYTRHVLAVVVIIFLYLRIHDHDLIIAAFLHDLVEDHPDDWTLEYIEGKYGRRAAVIVRAVTKPDYVKYGGKNDRHALATLNKVKQGGELAVILKLADRLHNLLTLWGTPESKQDKIGETTEYLLPLAHKYDVLWKELHLAIAEQILSAHIDDAEVSEVGH